jgi:hypothetical protein
VETLFIAWLYSQQNQVRPMFSPNATQEELIAASRAFDLAPQLPPVDWSKTLRTLPVKDIMKAAGGPKGIFADHMPVDTGGAMIEREPNDRAWYKGGLWHDNMKIDIPGFWFMSWYDVSIGPNLELFNHARNSTTDAEAAANQYVVVGPNTHCGFARLGKESVVGERSMGDTSFDVDGAVFGFKFAELMLEVVLLQPPRPITASRHITTKVRFILFLPSRCFGLAINLFAAILLPIFLEVGSVISIARRYAHHDSTLLDSFFVFLDALFWYPGTDKSADQTTCRTTRTSSG